MSKHIYTSVIDHICLNPNCNNITSNLEYCEIICARSHKKQLRTNKKIQKQKDLENIYNLKPNLCSYCKTPLTYDKRNNKFHNLSCSTSFNNLSRTDETREKQSKTMKKTLAKKSIELAKVAGLTEKPVKIPTLCKIKWRTCPITGKLYHTRNVDGNKRICSPYAKDLKEIYYMLTIFKFSVYEMPEYFDLKFLETAGWYSCPGRRCKTGNKNTAGVSRDHLYSRFDGIANKVHPLILSHPANCQLLLHKDNILKHSSSAISIENLIEKIINFPYTEKVPNHNKIVNLIKNNRIYITDFEELRKLI